MTGIIVISNEGSLGQKTKLFLFLSLDGGVCIHKQQTKFKTQFFKYVQNVFDK